MSDAPVFDVDPADFWDDPYPALARMRAEAPICFVPALGATLITKRDAINTCEKNVAVFSSEQPEGLMDQLMGQNMMRKDGDAHRAERFVYYPAISPSAVRTRWADMFAALADDVLATLDGLESVDLVPAYATRLSGEALKALTGLTNITYAQLDEFSQAMIDGVANYGGDPEVEARCHAATAAIDQAITERLPAISADPDDASLLAIMLRSGMDESKARANIKLTISGGQNEPRDAIAGAVWALLTHPDQLAMVTRGPAGWLDVFEEYCRWIAPIGMSPRRIATRHTHDDVTFEVGDRVFLMFGSAGRDEDHFDQPDRFDVTRDTGAALTFGVGPHKCAGAAASRSLIGDVALPRLFDRFPNLALDHAAAPVRVGGWAFRGPLSVPVRLT